jgi:nicotinamidase-related amidase
MELVGSVEAAGAAARLLAAFRKASWPVFHIQHLSIQPAATFFVPGTAGIDIHPSVTPLPEEPIIVKHYPNSFRKTNLLESLRHAEVNSILICGMMTSMCVDATVRAAFDLEFTCTIAQDACAAPDLAFNGETIPARHVHGAFLAAMGAVYAKIRTTDAILDNIAAC